MSYILTLTLMAVTAVIANESSRMWLLAVLFGDSPVESLGLDTVEPLDTATVYQDDIYQVFYSGYSAIMRLTGCQVRNLIAYGHTVAYVTA